MITIKQIPEEPKSPCKKCEYRYRFSACGNFDANSSVICIEVTNWLAVCRERQRWLEQVVKE